LENSNTFLIHTAEPSLEEGAVEVVGEILEDGEAVQEEAGGQGEVPGGQNEATHKFYAPDSSSDEELEVKLILKYVFKKNIEK